MIISAGLPKMKPATRCAMTVIAAALWFATPAQAGDGAATAVRVGNHPGFGRIVFDMAAGSTYDVATEGDRLLVVFQGAAAVEQPASLPRNVVSLQTGPGTATLLIVPGARVRPMHVGDRLILDVLDASPRSAKSEAAAARPAPRPPVTPGLVKTPQEPAASAVPGELKTKQAEPIAPTAAQLEKPVALPVIVPAPVKTPDAEPVPRAPRNAPPQPAEAAHGHAEPVVAEAAPVTPVIRGDLGATEPMRAASPAPPQLASVLPAASLAPKREPSLLPADIGVGAASFRRGGFGLVVLDRHMNLELPPGLDQQGLAGATVVQGAVASTLQVPLPADRSLRVLRVPLGWTVEAVDTPPEAVVRPQAAPDGTALPFVRPGRVVTVLDPMTGGVLLVGTSLVAGPEAAIGAGRRTPDYVLLPTWLGVAVEPVADQVDLHAALAGFVLTGSASAPAQMSAAIKGRRFDFPDEAPPALLNRLHALLAGAATAPPRARTRDRMAAAQGFMALGMGVEAQALMQLVVADDPQAAADAQVPALGAVAAVLAGRLDEADALDDPRLDGSSEVALWRGLRDRQRGQGTVAASGLAALAPLALAYPETLRRLVWPDVAEAAVEAGVPMAAEQLAPFARAMLLERSGKVDEALAAYKALEAGTDRLDQVRAAVRGVELRLASGQIGTGEAADLMERQGFAWRGDAREAGIRMRAAELRAAAGGWRVALDSLRQVEGLFPDMRAAIKLRKGAVFQSMLSAQGGDLSPLDVVLLAAEYADCVPDGPAGATLATLLADKLMALDLPARAIPVLQGLVRGAPAGPARAEFGSRLAQMLLDGGDPSGAVAALQASAASDLPPPLMERRGLLLAKTRAALGDLAGAVAGLMESGTASADDLRAKLLANAGDWRGSLEALSDLAAKIVPSEGVLGEAAQDALLRQASAAAQAPDPAMLRVLERYAPRMTGARADLFRVLTAPPLGMTSELPRAARELKLARVIPQRLQDLGSR